MKKARRDKPELFPLCDVLVLSGKEGITVERDNVSPQSVGEKAYGLSCIPEAWRTGFFVVDLTSKVVPADVVLLPALAGLGTNVDRLLLRSNNVEESMLQRGRHDSFEVTPEGLKEHLQKAVESAEVRMYVVQALIKSRSIGHLSNERRMKREARDWVWEVESGESVGASKSVAIRPWRKAPSAIQFPMVAKTALHIHTEIKEVAQWGIQFRSRLHFEWVWNGERVYLVQVDAESPIQGQDPRHSLKVPFKGFESVALQCFAASDCNDLPNIRKLENSRLYQRLGYQMPVFYVLKNLERFFDQNTDEVPAELLDDLRQLTKSPLIIRTDGTNIPEKKREMLPRTDELRNLDDATTWFVDKLIPLLRKQDTSTWGLVLIAHHFIPSVSSAWARADPSDNYVQIEALWGIPEGLYWFAHDTLIVRIRRKSAVEGHLDIDIEFVSRRIRFKSNFISPDGDGAWVVKEVSAPLDWRPVISNESWIEEITRTTCLIAQSEGAPVSVMWFVQNHPKATKHRVLPWFHSKMEDLGTVRAAPIKKRSASHVFSISTVTDWDDFRSKLSRNETIERCNVSPTDSGLVRNNEFVTELGRLASKFGVTIVLQGGLLSHAYYILKREGASLECVDLWGADSHKVEYFKLVRDKIPERISENGEKFEKIELRGEAKFLSLREKLIEEAIEALDASTLDQLVEELADVLEVSRSLCKEANILYGQVEAEADRKRDKRGGFDQGIMLTQTITPPSIQKERNDLSVGSMAPIERSITSQQSIPRRPVYKSSDLRQLQNGVFEKQLVCEFELGQIGEGISAHTNMDAHHIEGTLRKQVLSVRCLRRGATIRFEIKIVNGPPIDTRVDGQLTLPF